MPAPGGECRVELTNLAFSFKNSDSDRSGRLFHTDTMVDEVRTQKGCSLHILVQYNGYRLVGCSVPCSVQLLFPVVRYSITGAAKIIRSRTTREESATFTFSNRYDDA